MKSLTEIKSIEENVKGNLKNAMSFSHIEVEKGQFEIQTSL